MSKESEYRVEYGFSYKPRTGPHKGKSGVVVGPGEPIPDEILKDKERLAGLIQAQKISIRNSTGDFEVRKNLIILTEGQIDMLLKEGNANDLNKLLANPDISRESLIRLHHVADSRNLPAAVVKKIEGASMR